MPATAVGKWASSKTINGAFLSSISPNIRIEAHPPSSNESFFNVPVAFLASILPTLVEPVKDTFLTSGLVVSSSPTSWMFSCVVMTFKTPSGTPARRANYKIKVSRGPGLHC